MGAHAVRLSNIDIDNALKNKDFEVLFQPIFDLGNGGLARMETFVRWRHASLGVLPPGAFISFFETQGRMSELSRYVFDESLRQYMEWRGASAPGFSINLALSDLSDEAFTGHFTVALREAGFPAELITLECPMPPVTMDNAAASRHFQRLSETGARTVDPFPLAEIKTGGAAILRFARTVRGPGLSAISELLELANKNNAAITAVGVEDQASLSALKGLGFAAAQGNHLGRVGDLDDFSPSRVNEVRALLNLDPLSQDDLHALFRTGGPKVAKRLSKPAAESAVKTEATPATQRETSASERDDLIERLNARISKQSAEQVTADTQQEIGEENAKPARMTRRQLAQRRAAAIARAKKRAALGEETLASVSDSEAPAQQVESAAEKNKGVQADWARPKTGAAPRDMQQRLSDEFEAFASDSFDAPIDATPENAADAEDWEIVGDSAEDSAIDETDALFDDENEDAAVEAGASTETDEDYDAADAEPALQDAPSAATVEAETEADDNAAFTDFDEDADEIVVSDAAEEPAGHVSDAIPQEPDYADEETDLAASARADVFARLDGMPTSEARPFDADKLAPEPDFAPEYDTLSMKNVGARFIPAVHVTQALPQRPAPAVAPVASIKEETGVAPQSAVPETLAEEIADTPRIFGRKSAAPAPKEDSLAELDAAELLEDATASTAVSQADIFEDAALANDGEEQVAARAGAADEDHFDSDAIAEDFRRAKMKRRKKSFFTRTVIPFSALRVTHFWPRWLTALFNRKSEA